MEVGSEQERISEDDGSNKKRAEAPAPWDAKGGDDEHAEACCHAERRHHDFPERHGGPALADAPGKHAGKTDERNDSRDEGSRVHLDFPYRSCYRQVAPKRRSRNRTSLLYWTQRVRNGLRNPARAARGHEGAS